MNTGVYQILNLANGKIYVGSTTHDLHIRKLTHFNNLRKGKHHNSYLQNAWDKYGEQNFIFNILEYCPKPLCYIKEQVYLDLLKAYDRTAGYNLVKKVGDMRGAGSKVKGRKHTDEAKKNMSIAQKGRKLSAQHLHNIRNRKPYLRPNARKAILQFNLNGELIKEWSGALAAAQELYPKDVKAYKAISNSLKRNTHKYLNSRWYYKDKAFSSYPKPREHFRTKTDLIVSVKN